jgi:hypothetical protein
MQGPIRYGRLNYLNRCKVTIQNRPFPVMIPAAEFNIKSQTDHIVVVLDQRLGDNLGWMGTRTYTTDWNNQPDWLNIGYPEDRGGGQIPFWQDQVSFEDADNPGIVGQEGPGLYMDTETASLDHGNSGGPFFAFWDQNADHPGWHIVSVVSAEGTLDWAFDDDNWASGGKPYGPSGYPSTKRFSIESGGRRDSALPQYRNVRRYPPCLIFG